MREISSCHIHEYSKVLAHFYKLWQKDIINVSEVLLIFLYCSLATVPVVFHCSIFFITGRKTIPLAVRTLLFFFNELQSKAEYNFVGSLKLGHECSTTINPSSHSALSSINFIIFLNVLLY